MSSAAIIGIAIYGSSMTPAWASELRQSRRQEVTRIERVERKINTGDITVGEGTVKTVGQGVLVVTRKKDGKDFSVLVDSKTKIFQGFGKKVGIDQVMVGHELFVKGKLTNGDGSSLAAKVIRDMTIKVRLDKK
jgi:hypothetical protein